MKHFIFTMCCICLHTAYANKIDSLKTDADILAFVKKFFQEKPDSYPDKYYEFSVTKPDSTTRFFQPDSIGIAWSQQKWKKVDFNKDDKTDLFVIIYIRNINYEYADTRVCAIIDNGNNTFSLFEIPGYDKFESYAAMPSMIGEEQVLLYHYRKGEDSVVEKKSVESTSIFGKDSVVYYEITRTDTLIYKFGGFIEKNRKVSSPKKIKAIFFDVSFCFVSCPSFKILIFSDRSASLIKEETLDQKQGCFRTAIDESKFNQLIGLLRYLPMEDYDNYYHVNATDLQRAQLTIYFADGTSKSIGDYGMQGTMGLARLYKIFFDLSANEQWK